MKVTSYNRIIKKKGETQEKAPGNEKRPMEANKQLH